MSRQTAPAPTLFACPITGCGWHRTWTVHELDSDGDSVFAVPVPRRIGTAELLLAPHADEHARAAEVGRFVPLFRLECLPDDPGPVLPDDDGPVDEGELGPILEAWTVPDGWWGE
jgi:hypothetical protein